MFNCHSNTDYDTYTLYTTLDTHWAYIVFKRSYGCFWFGMIVSPPGWHNSYSYHGSDSVSIHTDRQRLQLEQWLFSDDIRERGFAATFFKIQEEYVRQHETPIEWGDSGTSSL